MNEEAAKIVAVFGAHTAAPGSPEYSRAYELGVLLARNGFTVANGGYGGTMAAVSEGASQEGGEVIGVSSDRIEQFRNARLNPWVTQEVHYLSLQERMLHLVQNNAAMIALPGGIGTLTELALAWNLMQVGEIPERPLVLLGDMWPEVMAAFIKIEYVPQEYQDLISFAGTPAEAVEYINKWIRHRK